MGSGADAFNAAAAWINGILWSQNVLYLLLGVGIYFTLRSRFIQYRSLTHGTALVLGGHDDEQGPGAISHFQALSTALSATVGLGNIGGVALAVAMGGPGAVFWMWVVGVLGMAIKTMEVTQSMIFRNTDDPQNPHGGAMWVADRGIAEHFPNSGRLGKWVGGLFCLTLLLATFTGGNVFQVWNTGVITQQNFGIPTFWVGLILATLVGLVILGGISRIGMVTGRVVPLMCGLYMAAALFVVISNIGMVPDLLILIVKGAFSGLEAQGAFLGGTAGWAFSIGLQRAFFSNEAGQGSSSMAHAAVRTDEPAREGLVAGLEPFIDTLVVCTLTALVILISGSWNRDQDLQFKQAPVFQPAGADQWSLSPTRLDQVLQASWDVGDRLTIQVSQANSPKPVNLTGVVALNDGEARIVWPVIGSERQPTIQGGGLYHAYDGASLTAHSFDLIVPGLGRWLVTLASWLFALSTLISWSYYGEQGVVYLLGEKWVMGYKLLFIASILIGASGLIRDATELNNLTMLGTGAMLFVNVPIMLVFSSRAIAVQKDYLKRCLQKVRSS